LRQGFTFDVMWDEEEERLSLIELNSFGTRSGCGACLFHCLKDGEAKYGKNRDGNGEVEFRNSVVGSKEVRCAAFEIKGCMAEGALCLISRVYESEFVLLTSIKGRNLI
jgi:hypothetical protein